MQIKKGILLKTAFFPLINYLHAGYWAEQESLIYYDDIGKSAQGDLLGRLILLEDCIKLVLAELFEGIYQIEFMMVDVTKTYDFGRLDDTSIFKNWLGWTSNHKKLCLIEPEPFEWVLNYKYELL